MVINIILGFFIVYFLGTLILGVFDFLRKKRENKKIDDSITKYLDLGIKSDQLLMDYLKLSFGNLEKITKDIGMFLLTTEEVPTYDPSGFATKIPINTSTIRVWAVSLRKVGTFEMKVYAIPAQTLSEAMDMANKHLGRDWELFDSTFIEVVTPKGKEEVKKYQDSIVEMKIPGYAEFASYIIYVANNFTKTKVEKELLLEVVERIKKKHGDSTKKNT